MERKRGTSSQRSARLPILGRTFHQFVQEKPSLSVRKRVAEELMEALETLHAHQIVHGDLKQDNILITDVGNHVRLIDFGFSDTDAYVAKIAITRDNEALVKIIGCLFPGRLNVVRMAVLRRWRLTWLLPLIAAVCIGMVILFAMIPALRGTAEIAPVIYADTTRQEVRKDTVVITQQVVRRDTVVVYAQEDSAWISLKQEMDSLCKGLYDLYADSITNMPEKEYRAGSNLHHAYALRMFDLKLQLLAAYPEYEEQIEQACATIYNLGYTRLLQMYKDYPYIMK